jgi:type IV secretory pathway VirD2 relaxase
VSLLGTSAAPQRRSSEAIFSGQRRCVIKARYVPMNLRGRGACELHLRYLERDGVERDGSAGRLYGADVRFDPAVFGKPVPGERNQFRFIVSPEDARELDLTAYTRGLMRQVEADLGRSVDWAAVNHYNTDQPHVHIVVRGVDRDGRELRIPRQYISFGMRDSAERLLTRELGLRSEHDIGRQRAREVGAERFTSLDRGLVPLVAADGALSFAALQSASRGERMLFHARLEVLRRLGLAERRGTSWVLERDWQRSLRELGVRGDIIKRMAAAVPGDLGPYRILESAPAKPFEGVVRGKGLHDELAGTFFAVVGSAEGETFYLPVSAELGESLEVGDIVHVGSDGESWVKPNDRVVAKFAELNGGLYDPKAHEENLANLRREPGQAALAPAVLVAANVRRLERLAKFGLAERLPGGRWQVPPDLIRQLEQRQRAGRPQRLLVRKIAPSLAAQVGYEGPTWLDGVSSSRPGLATHGFGAELARAQRARAEFLERRAELGRRVARTPGDGQ